MSFKTALQKFRTSLASMVHVIQAAALTTYATTADIRSMLSPRAAAGVSAFLLVLGFVVNWMDAKAKQAAITKALYTPVPDKQE